MKLYHGTNASNIFDVMDNAKMTNGVNGRGLYLTSDLQVARGYGSKVICWDVNIDIPMVIRPMEGMDCMEFVITTQSSLNNLLLECDSEVVS